MESSLFRYIWMHSRRDQVFLLCLVVLSLPFYFASFDIPKSIINDAIQGKAFAAGNATTRAFDLELHLPDFFGGGSYVLFSGFELERTELLWSLSGLFLALVIINGAFKYVINVEKGVLGERMLRRLRFELFSRLIHFRPEDIRLVRPAEAATIIKDEVEPVGSFAGEAFITPALLSLQALTALVFIFVQSLWLGSIAAGIVVAQAIIIPILRREQLRLSRERQIESRALAGRIGEYIEAGPSIHVHGVRPFTLSEIGNRLWILFRIRVELFKRKFAVKYLNNFLAQITPFFFYAIGGYLALRGQIDIGQLVAVIAAYRDLPPPIKELIDWDQERADVMIKYQQVVAQFPSERILRPVSGQDEVALPAAETPVMIQGLRVADARGAAQLESTTAELPRPSLVGVVGAAGSGRDMLVKILGRQISTYQGDVKVGAISWQQSGDEALSRMVTYAGPDAMLFSGSIRENLTFGLLHHRPESAVDGVSASERLRRREAERSGNPVALPGDDWIACDGVAVRDPGDLDRQLVRALEAVGFESKLHALGLAGKIDAAAMPDVSERLLMARGVILRRLTEGNAGNFIEPFDPTTYNTNATIAENLLFGLPTGPRYADGQLANDGYARSVLEAEALVIPLADIGLKMAETVLDLYETLHVNKALFERFSLIRAEDIPQFERIIADVKAAGSVSKISEQSRVPLVAIALGYVEPRHRLGLIDEVFRRRVLRARQSFRRHLAPSDVDQIEFYDPTLYMSAASIQDNLLFGRIPHDVGHAEATVHRELRAVLRDLDLEPLVHRVALDHQVGVGGRAMFAQDRAAIALARCVVSHSQMVVIDGALAGFASSDVQRILRSVRRAYPDTTLVVAAPVGAALDGFDVVLSFEDARFASLKTTTPAKPSVKVPAPPAYAQ